MSTLIIILYIIFSFVYLVLLAIAFYKLIKSKLSDWAKIIWCLLFSILQILAIVIFIIYHDFYLNKNSSKKEID